jgi:hypothetical protein
MTWWWAKPPTISPLSISVGGAHFFGMFDERRKIFRLAVFPIRNVLESVESRCSGRVNPIDIGGRFAGRNNAVCRKENDAVEVLEIFGLMPPRTPIVAYKMTVFLKAG